MFEKFPEGSAQRSAVETEKMKILFPESEDPRVQEAIKILNGKGVCYALSMKEFDETVDVEILAESYMETNNKRYENKPEKQINIDRAREMMGDRLYRAAAALARGDVDACIAGNESSTGDVIRAGLQVVGMEEGTEKVSSFFIMKHKDRVSAFTDCAVNENPTAEQLAAIAITTAKNYQRITGKEPVIAMLSHSTSGSAEGPSVDKVRRATEIVRKMVLEKNLKMKVLGEIEFGEAFTSEANVFVFPDLATGNSAYKNANRLGDEEAMEAHMYPASTTIESKLPDETTENDTENVSNFCMMKRKGRVLAFADCAAEDPSVEQLADTAIVSADHYKEITGENAIVAMISYSTFGSAKGEAIKKINEAIKRVRERRPNDIQIIEQEIQFDAAFDPGVGKSKTKGESELAGKANVFVFPNRSAGSINRDVAENIEGAEAVGPLIQGFAHPFMDLSRGCDVDDIWKLALLLIAMHNASSKSKEEAPTPSQSHETTGQRFDRAA